MLLKKSSQTATIIIMTVIIMSGSIGALAQDEEGTQEKTREESSAGKKTANFERLVKYIPLNEPIDQIEIPQYEEGLQVALLKAAVAWRVSDTKFRMEMLEIQVFENGEPVMTLTTPTARYNLKRRILASRSPSKIVHHGEPGFTSHGQGMVFDLNRRVGSLLKGAHLEISVPPSKSKSESNSAKSP